MKKILFSFLLVTGFAIAANAQSNANATATSPMVNTESAAPSESADAVNEAGVQSTDNGTKKSTEATGTKKACCAHGKKASASCGDKKSDMRSEEKVEQ